MRLPRAAQPNTLPDAHACHPHAGRATRGRRRRGAASASGLAQTFDGQRYPFRDIELTLARRKVGLVGANGVGKSSLLKVLVGADAPESGDVRLTKDVQLAYVEQDPTLPDGALAEEFFMAPSCRASRRCASLARRRRRSRRAATTRRRRWLARASDAMDERAWALESEMKKLCEVLRVRSLLRTPASALSGGSASASCAGGGAARAARPPAARRADQPPGH